MNGNYVTKQDLKEEFARFEGIFHERIAQFEERMMGLFIEFQRNIVNHIDENFATKQELKLAEERINENINDTETRLLRGFEHHARAVASHLTVLDGHTAANFLGQASFAERMSALEARMLDLETRRRPS